VGSGRRCPTRGRRRRPGASTSGDRHGAELDQELDAPLSDRGRTHGSGGAERHGRAARRATPWAAFAEWNPTVRSSATGCLPTPTSSTSTAVTSATRCPSRCGAAWPPSRITPIVDGARTRRVVADVRLRCGGPSACGTASSVRFGQDARRLPAVFVAEEHADAFPAAVDTVVGDQAVCQRDR
jgi:hypothetical protein